MSIYEEEQKKEPLKIETKNSELYEALNNQLMTDLHCAMDSGYNVNNN